MQRQFRHTLTIQDSIASFVLFLNSKTNQKWVNQNISFVNVKVANHLIKNSIFMLQKFGKQSIEDMERDGGKVVCFELFSNKVSWSEVWIRRV